nr:hypothetical protein BaRGS_014013 [Batillaria attramentaria]
MTDAPLQGTQGKKKKNLLWVTDPPCLADAITRYTQHGERFVSVSMTGVQADGDYVMPAIGVELIFEEPVQRPSEKYVYHVAPVPVTVHHCHRGKGKNFLGLANITCDWLGTFNQYLYQGWRLVDIYIDIRPSPGVVFLYKANPGYSAKERGLVVGTTRTMTRFQHVHKRGRFTFKYITWKPVDMNSLWIFEKPAARERELAPVYEGTVVPFSFQLDKTNCKTNKNLPDLNWDHVIWDMGKRGWELASFVDVAGFRPANPSSNSEFIVTSLMFFQRPIPPPSYDFVATAGWDLSVQSGPAQGGQGACQVVARGGKLPVKLELFVHKKGTGDSSGIG